MNAFKSLGSNVVFTEAQYLFYGGSTNGCAFAKKLSESIEFATVTYETKPDIEDEVIDYYTSPYTGYDDLDFCYAHFNLTKPLNEWLNSETNNGFAIVTDDEDFYGAFILNGVQIKSTSTETYTTTLILDYIDMGGYNPKYTYDEKHVGRAGTGYVNLLTQQLTVIRDDFSVLGENEFTLGMMFDSATSKKLQELGHTGVLAYGNNWIPNYLRAYLFTDETHVNILHQNRLCG